MFRAILKALRWVKFKLFKDKGTTTTFEFPFNESVLSDYEVYINGVKWENHEDEYYCQDPSQYLTILRQAQQMETKMINAGTKQTMNTTLKTNHNMSPIIPSPSLNEQRVTRLHLTPALQVRTTDDVGLAPTFLLKLNPATFDGPLDTSSNGMYGTERRVSNPHYAYGDQPAAHYRLLTRIVHDFNEL